MFFYSFYLKNIFPWFCGDNVFPLKDPLCNSLSLSTLPFDSFLYDSFIYTCKHSVQLLRIAVLSTCRCNMPNFTSPPFLSISCFFFVSLSSHTSVTDSLMLFWYVLRHGNGEMWNSVCAFGRRAQCAVGTSTCAGLFELVFACLFKNIESDIEYLKYFCFSEHAHNCNFF